MLSKPDGIRHLVDPPFKACSVLEESPSQGLPRLDTPDLSSVRRSTQTPRHVQQLPYLDCRVTPVGLLTRRSEKRTPRCAAKPRFFRRKLGIPLLEIANCR